MDKKQKRKMAFFIIAGFVCCNIAAQAISKSGTQTVPVDSFTILRSDTLSNWEKFKKQSIGKIKANESRIAELKTSIANGRDGVRLSYQRSINDAERKNDSLRNRLDYFTDERSDSLELFKQKFNADITAITQSLKKIKSNSDPFRP